MTSWLHKFLILLTLFVGNAGISFALPVCPITGFFHDCYGTFNYTNGSKYVGEFKDNKRHGQGTYTWADGEKYVGEWKNGNQNGQGTHIYADGGKYLGQWKDGKQNGHGTDTWTNGDKYAGEFSNGRRDGHGTYFYDNGNLYIGEYKNSKRHGRGTFIWADGDEYVGNFKDGMYHGQGIFTWADGSKDVGTWEKDKLNGYAIRYRSDGSIKEEGIFKDDKLIYAEKRTNQNSTLPNCPASGYLHNCYGTYIWDNGDKYVGEHTNNEMHGHGTYIFGTNSEWAGDKYVGNWENNVRTGQGTYTYNNGDKYFGEFKNNEMHGQGYYVWDNGDNYVGSWENNNRSGQGTYNYTNENMYVGRYKNNKRHGQGTFTFANGEKWHGAWESNKLNGYAITYYADGSVNQEGLFKDDKFLHAQKKSTVNSTLKACPTSSYRHNCFGTFTWSDGGTYSGEWQNGKMQGQGTYTQANGNIYVGQWEDNNRHGQGTYTWKDGRIWQGEWSKSELNGFAIKYDANGNIAKEGMFENGKFLYTQFKEDTIIKAKSCNDDPTLCTVAQLCNNASYYSDGNKAWKKDYSSQMYVAEAKKNGVTCGVNLEIDKTKMEEILPAASGSGFFITKNGHLITNAHVIEECQEVKIHYDGIVHKSTIMSSDKFNDLALLKINYKPEIIFSLAKDPPFLGQDIIAAGYPLVSDLGNTLKVTSGIVSALSAIDDTSKFQMDVPVQPGNSGGPIFDINGNILGVVVARSTHEETQLVNFGIKAATVRNLLDANNIKLQPPNIEPINKRKFSEAMTKGTVLLSCWMTLSQIKQFNKQSSDKVFFKEFQQ